MSNSAPGQANANSYTVPGLTNGTAYTFGVRAVNAVGDGTASTEATATPTGLAAAGDDTQITVMWAAPASNGNSAITAYALEVSTTDPSGTASWTALTLGNGLDTSYAHTGLGDGVTRWYRVSATNGIGAGAFAAPVMATTHDVPGAPSNLTATPTVSFQVRLDWTTPDDDGGSAITSFEVKRKTVDTDTGWLPISGSGPNTTSYNEAGLVNGTEYTFLVRAVNAKGDGAESNEAIVTPRDVPAAISDLAAARGDRQVVLTWTTPTDGGSDITRFEYRQKSGGGAYGPWMTVPNSGVGGANVAGYTVTNLTNGTAYTFEVRARNDAGPAPASEITATPATLPAAPVLTATPANRQVTLSWTVPDNGGSTITDFEYQQKTTGDYGGW